MRSWFIGSSRRVSTAWNSSSLDAEVVVHRRQVHPGGRGEAAQARRLEPVLREQRLRRVQDAGLGVLRQGVHRGRSAASARRGHGDRGSRECRKGAGTALNARFKRPFESILGRAPRPLSNSRWPCHGLHSPAHHESPDPRRRPGRCRLRPSRRRDPDPRGPRRRGIPRARHALPRRRRAGLARRDRHPRRAALDAHHGGRRAARCARSRAPVAIGGAAERGPGSLRPPRLEARAGRPTSRSSSCARRSRAWSPSRSTGRRTRPAQAARIVGRGASARIGGPARETGRRRARPSTRSTAWLPARWGFASRARGRLRPAGGPRERTTAARRRSSRSGGRIWSGARDEASAVRASGKRTCASPRSTRGSTR